jgi:uncharacterized phage-associated protein
MEKKLIQYDSVDIARYLIQECLYNKVNDIGNTKINKLLYIVYGIFLALYERPILNESPKYFPYGPVFPRVYRKYAELKPLEFNIDEKLKEVIEFTMKYFSNISAGKLSAWSHEEGSPWDKIHKTDNVYGIELDNNDIYEYFKKIVRIR